MSDDAEQDARAFFVDSRFEQLARRPGGMPRDEALERAQATIDEIRPSFGDWLDGELKELSRVVEQNGPHGSNDPNWTNAAYTQCLRIRGRPSISIKRLSPAACICSSRINSVTASM